MTEVAWEDLERESVGGSGNVSAYCLMYVDAKRRDLFEGEKFYWSIYPLWVDWTFRDWTPLVIFKD